MPDNDRKSLGDGIMRLAAVILFTASGLIYALGGSAGKSERISLINTENVFTEEGRRNVGEEQQRAKDEANAPLHININSDDISELSKLPGIGEKRAQDIISFRNEHGDFATVEDIMLVKGIKGGTYEKIKEFIYVEDDCRGEENSGGG